MPEMLTLQDGVKAMEKLGYKDNLRLDYDHFRLQGKNIDLYPQDFTFDAVIRFENASDPDDQAILYAITSRSKNIKGLYAESYGLYSHEMAPAIVAKIREFHEREQHSPGLILQ